VPADENAMQNLARKMQQEGFDDYAIYDEIAKGFEDYGCSLVYYEQCYSQNNEDIDTANQSQKKIDKQAKGMAVAAADEFENKLRCIEFERCIRKNDSRISLLTTPAPPAKMVHGSEHCCPIRVGEYVNVSEDLSEGVMSHGGTGWVKAVDGTYPSWMLTIEYTECSGAARGRTEKQVPIRRVTVIPMPLSRPRPTRAAPKGITQSDAALNSSNGPGMDLIDLLRDGFLNGRAKGWRKKDVERRVQGASGLRAARTEDAKILHSYLKANPNPHMDCQRYANRLFKQSRSKFMTPFSFVYLAHAWGCTNRTLPILASMLILSQNWLYPSQT